MSLAVALKLAPIFLLFALGVLLRRLGVLTPTHADWLLRAVVYVGLPALIVGTVPRAELRFEFAWLPAIALVAVFTGWALARAYAARTTLPRQARGVLIVGPMIMNVSMIYPFVLAMWGEEAVARLVMFDIGHSAVTLTATYVLAAHYGAGQPSLARAAMQVAYFPPFVALVLALALNVAGAEPPRAATVALERIGWGLVLLLMVALGIHFRIVRTQLRYAATVAGLRIAAGVIVGGFAYFVFEGLTRAVAVAALLAPVGFNTLVYAFLHRLDVERAAAAVSVSVAAALVYLPLALHFLT